eukprot:6708550-Heterocapsa_arctica.AAC.1
MYSEWQQVPLHGRAHISGRGPPPAAVDGPADRARLSRGEASRMSENMRYVVLLRYACACAASDPDILVITIEFLTLD